MVFIDVNKLDVKNTMSSFYG